MNAHRYSTCISLFRLVPQQAFWRFSQTRRWIVMKRVKAACICQTLHFMLKEDLEHSYAVKMVQEEVAQYKRGLDRNQTKYKIIEENEQPDGSIMLKVIKQYNNSPVGDYLD